MIIIAWILSLPWLSYLCNCFFLFPPEGRTAQMNVKEVLPDVVFYMIDFDLRVKCPSCKDLCLSVGKSYWVVFVKLLTKTSKKCEPMPVCFTDSSLLPDSVLFKQSIFPQESLLVTSTSHGYCLMSLLFYRNIRNQRTSIPFESDISLK